MGIGNKINYKNKADEHQRHFSKIMWSRNKCEPQTMDQKRKLSLQVKKTTRCQPFSRVFLFGHGYRHAYDPTPT